MMDRRSWLWRRRSSEKSPGETESSGSISSRSERFSDEQVYTIQTTKSHEVTSKAVPEAVDSDDVKSLKEKLADALSQIKQKEDTAKQHAKVAEEAVAGWEKAENEVLSVRQQLEAATQKNLALEDRMNHLDGALKEFVRQLRQAKEEQEQMINDAVIKKTQEWETMKSELQSQVAYYSIQHTNVVAEMTATNEKDRDFQSKLDTLSRENSSLRLQIFRLTEEMKVITIERDYSVQAAETSSKQRFEISRKMTKLEAEFLRLKSLARKSAMFNENKSVTASSIYVDSVTDNQSDCGDKVMLLDADLRKMGIIEPKNAESEIARYKSEKPNRQNPMDPQVETEYLDDFLKMERVAAIIPDPKSQKYFGPEGSLAGQPYQMEMILKAELESMLNRTSELEEKLKNIEALNVDMNKALVESQNQLKISQTRLKETEEKLENVETLNTEMSNSLSELHKQLQKSQTMVKEYAEKWVELKTQLTLANESMEATEKQLQAINAQKEETEARLLNVEAEKGALLETMRFLEGEIEKERSLSAEMIAKCQKLEDEFEKTKTEADKKEKALLADITKSLVKCEHLEEEVRKTKCEVEVNRAASKLVRDFEVNQEKELQIAAHKFAECQKTVASLGSQLKSLASLEDFILVSETSITNSDEVSTSQGQRVELSDPHSNKSFMPKNDSEHSISESGHLSALHNPRDYNSSRGLLSDSIIHSSDRSKSGFGRLSSRVLMMTK